MVRIESGRTGRIDRRVRMVRIESGRTCRTDRRVRMVRIESGRTCRTDRRVRMVRIESGRTCRTDRRVRMVRIESGRTGRTALYPNHPGMCLADFVISTFSIPRVLQFCDPSLYHFYAKNTQFCPNFPKSTQFYQFGRIDL